MTTTTTSPWAYALVRTQFHGGGIVSRHRSRAAAERAQRRYQSGLTCTCGCVCVVAHSERLPAQGQAAHYSHPSAG